MLAIEGLEIDLLEWHRYQIEMKTEMLAMSQGGASLAARYRRSIKHELDDLLPQQILEHIRAVELLTQQIERQAS